LLLALVCSSFFKKIWNNFYPEQYDACTCSAVLSSIRRDMYTSFETYEKWANLFMQNATQWTVPDRGCSSAEGELRRSFAGHGRVSRGGSASCLHWIASIGCNPLDCTALMLSTFGVHFRHTGSGITVQFYDGYACPGGRCTFPVKWC